MIPEEREYLLVRKLVQAWVKEKRITRVEDLAHSDDSRKTRTKERRQKEGSTRDVQSTSQSLKYYNLFDKENW